MSEAAQRGPRRPPPWRTGLAVAAAASLALHVAFYLYTGWFATTPDVGLEFQLPSQVEFGLTQSVDPMAPGPAGEDAPEKPSEPKEGEPAEGAAAAAGDAETPDEDPKQKPDPAAERAKGRGPEDAPGMGDGVGTEALPPGAQLALRMDMARVRSSPISADVRKLLSTIPDWQYILGDSGLDPVDDLARVLIASPNLRRDNVVIAGRHTGSADLPREIVDRMAAARGEEAAWSTRMGVPVAPWPDRDATERVIALIGDQRFTISRPQDLPRVLAVAQARQARRRASDGGTAAPSPDPDAWGEALLSLEDDEALTLEVEGARNYVRGAMTDRFPIRVRLAVVDSEDGAVRLTGEGTYPNVKQARDALAYAQRVRDAYSGNLMVRMLGLQSALSSAELERKGKKLHLEARLTLGQIRFVLGYVERSLSRGRRPQIPPPTPDRGADEPTGDELGGGPSANPYRSPGP